MTGLPLIRRKLMPPRLPPHMVTRRALHAALLTGLEHGKRLTIVCGGPGYGKSTLAAAYGRELELPLAWYTLEESDTDLGTFLAYMDGALRLAVPSLPRRAVELSRSAASVEAVAQTVVGLLAEDLGEAAEAGGLLVLDDLHAVGNVPAISQAVEHLARYLPDNWQLLLTSREQPALPLGQLRVRQQLVEIGVRELRFNAAELRELLRGLAGLTLSNADCLELLGQTDGWVASVILAAQAVRGASGDARTLLFRELDHPAAMYDYLAQEVFGRQDEALQQFLLETALLPHLDAGLCRDALGLEDAASRLQRLVAGQLLFALSPDEEAPATPAGLAYAYQPTFRRFLLNRLQETRTGAEVKALSARLGDALAGSNPEDALTLLLRGEALERAEAIAISLAEELLAHNQLDRVKASLERFPSDHRLRSAALCFYLGEVHRLWGELDLAASLLTRAADAGMTGGQAWRGRALIHLAAVHVARQDPQAEALLAAGEAACAPADMRARGFAQNLRGALAFGAQELETAVACYEASLACWRQLADPVGQAKALVNLGLCHTRFGRFETALATCLEAVAQSEQAGRVPPPMTYNNMAAIYTYQGRIPEAWAAAQRALELARLLRSRRDQLYAEVALGAAALAQGEVRRAEGHFEAARDGALTMQDRGTAAKALVGLAETALHQGSAGRAQARLDEAAALVALPPEDPRNQDAAITQVAVWLEAGELDRAGSLLASLMQVCEALGYRFRQTQLAFWQARLLQRRGERADEAWELAHRLAEAGGFKALGEAEGAHRTSAHAATRVVPAAPVVTPTLQPAIRIDTLGGLRVVVGGREVGVREWRGYKTKLILAYLLAHPEGVTKEALTDLLYGEMDTTRTAILVLLSRLRHALEPDLGKGAPSRFVQFVDGRYLFNFALPYTLDTEELAYHMRQGGDERQPLDDRLRHWRQAIALHGGPYMADMTAESPWLTIERERHHRLLQEAHTSLIRACLGRDDMLGALDAAESNLAFDACSEQAHQVKMRVLARLGQRDQALRHFQIMKQVLQRELGLAPSAASESLHQAIARGAEPVGPEL
ncbi:MAG: BTAD domain-containing putative transcriptional regulator [Candidatus Sericytochromatia bacterium]|nr:BTAD domain-containing putative transcriptional regulator [Candidatus Sericytochromatia bacterium]